MVGLSPHHKHNLIRIIPYGLIWLFTGVIFLFVEAAATGNRNMNPDDAITLTLPVFIFAMVAVFLFGLLFGAFQIFVLSPRLKKQSLTRKIGMAFLTYFFIILAISMVSFPIAATIELKTSILSEEVWQKTGRFLFSTTFISTLVQLSVTILLSLFYSAISENLGHNMLRNFITGKYHAPVEEKRIFMFLDMKSSTTIAEKLGHVAYFELLSKYYEVMARPIIDHYGEVYQYIGDEVVVTWEFKRGIADCRCIECFFSIKQAMTKTREAFEKKYGVYPDFKAGMHLGEVTTGELGALKKEIVYTGDVLNTSARLQSLCAQYGYDLIISSNLWNEVNCHSGYRPDQLGKVDLKGKHQKMEILGLNKP